MKPLVLIFFVLIFSGAEAQNYYYQSGSPTDPANWNTELDGSGTSATNFTTSGVYTIPTGRTATVFSPWNFGTTGSVLRVSPGGVLKNDVGIQMNSFSTLVLDSGALYINNNVSIASLTIFNGGEVFNQYSTVRIDNWSSPNEPVYNGINPSLFGFYFGNLEINWATLSTVWEQKYNNSNPTIFCRNDLIIDSTGTGSIRFHDETSGIPSGQAVIKIRGNLIQNGGTVNLFTGYNIPEVYKTNFELSGDFIQNNGFFGAGGASFGKITFVKLSLQGPDTSYQKFYTQFPTHTENMRYNVNPWCALRLMSDMYGNFTDTACGLYVNGGGGSARAAIDFQTYKVYNACRIRTDNNVNLYIGSPAGYRNNNGGLPEGNLAPIGAGLISLSPFTKIIFSGALPQVTGNEMPDIFSTVYIQNSQGVTLSKNLKIFELTLTSGKLNLGDYNLIIPNVNYISGNGLNNFINTNGNGFFKTYINGTLTIPVGNGSYNPIVTVPNGGHQADTFSIRVKNGFDLSQLPSDTSYCVRKTWEMVENIQGGSNLLLYFQWARSDEGAKFKSNIADRFQGAVGVSNYNGYNGYRPFDSYTRNNPFSGSSDTNVAMSSSTYGIAGSYQQFNSNNKFVVGLYRGIYEYYFYNSGNAATLNNWKRNEDGTGAAAQSFDRYEVFNILQNKNAVFNTSVTFTNKTILRAFGNGQLTSNQPVTNQGSLELYDSATYNHNNIGVAASTIFAGQEILSPNSTFNITMWSDTANAIRDGLQTYLGNLVINFTNLADPGSNGRWRNAKFSISNNFCRNLRYIQSSGYELCLNGTTQYNYPFNMIISGNVQIGDSVIAPDANPTVNLSYGSAQGGGSSAGAMVVGGNLDLQRGRIKSEQSFTVANGSISFWDMTGQQHRHYISSYCPVDPAIFNIGNNAYPMSIGQLDTVILRTNFYNTTDAPYLGDIFEIQDRAVMDCDTFSLGGMNIRVKKGGKIIIRNKEGINFNLNFLQNIIFEDGGMLELAGYENQKLYKTGTTAMPNISNLIINNPNGITLNEEVTITDTLRFVQGKVSSVLTFLQFTDTTATIGASNWSYIDAPVRFFTKSTVTKVIPFGKYDKLRPMYFQPTGANPAQWIGQYIAGDPHSIGSTYGGGINNISSNEFYFINNLTPGISAYVGLSFGPESGVSNVDSLRVAHWNGSLWENMGVTYAYGIPQTGYIISDVCTGFDYFALSSTNSQPMPVELSSFASAVAKNDVTLNWSTAQEQNNKGFDIERKSSFDTTWKKVSFINGAGNTNSQTNYKYEDRNLATAKYHYRLKQIDNNGNYKYYVLQNEISVGVPQKFALSQNYPNPFNPTTKIDFELPQDVKLSINIFDMTGRLISTLINNEAFMAGYHTIQFNGSALSSGTYFYRITAGENVQTKKMTLIK